MKSTSVFSIALLVAGAAVATPVNVISPSCLAVMPVVSSNSEVVISVPWVECGASSTNCISVTNFVLTAGLKKCSDEYSSDGDELRWYDDDQHPHTWIVGHNGSWEEITTSYNDVVYPGISPTAQILKQGQALILTRHSPTNTDGTAKTFYLAGQVGTNATVRSTIPGAGYTLVAPPANIVLSPADLTNTTYVACVSGGYAHGDRIYIESNNGVRRFFKYDGRDPSKYPTGGSWGSSSNTLKIDIGRGFWYYRTSNDALTLEWKSATVPHVSYEEE